MWYLCVFKRKSCFYSNVLLDQTRFSVNPFQKIFCQMPVALRLAFILFLDCNIAAPVSFFSGEGPLTYTHHNP